MFDTITPMKLLHLYRTPALPPAKKHALVFLAKQNIFPEIGDIETEFCFNIETTAPLSDGERKMLRWLLAETFEPENLSDRSFLIGSNSPSPPFHKEGADNCIVEVGPRMNFMTAWSTNAVSVCHACGLTKIMRIEHP